MPSRSCGPSLPVTAQFLQCYSSLCVSYLCSRAVDQSAPARRAQPRRFMHVACPADKVASELLHSNASPIPLYHLSLAPPARYLLGTHIGLPTRSAAASRGSCSPLLSIESSVAAWIQTQQPWQRCRPSSSSSSCRRLRRCKCETGERKEWRAAKGGSTAAGSYHTQRCRRLLPLTACCQIQACVLRLGNIHTSWQWQGSLSIVVSVFGCSAHACSPSCLHGCLAHCVHVSCTLRLGLPSHPGRAQPAHVQLPGGALLQGLCGVVPPERPGCDRGEGAGGHPACLPAGWFPAGLPARWPAQQQGTRLLSGRACCTRGLVGLLCGGVQR